MAWTTREGVTEKMGDVGLVFRVLVGVVAREADPGRRRCGAADFETPDARLPDVLGTLGRLRCLCELNQVVISLIEVHDFEKRRTRL